MRQDDVNFPLENEVECLDISYTLISEIPALYHLLGLYCEGAPI